MRYKLTYSIPVRNSWLGWDYPQHHEYAKTKEELSILIACVNEDASIVQAFYEDISNGKISHIKPGFISLP